MYDVANVILRWKFIVLYVYIRKGRSEINNLSFHLRNLKNEKQTKSKASRRKAINDQNEKAMTSKTENIR